MIWQLSIRNTKRNARRTGLTIATVALGCTLLIVGMSWIAGIIGGIINANVQTGGQVRITTMDFYQKEALFPIEENMPITAEMVKKISALDKVESVYPKISMGVAASVGGNEVGEVFGLLIGAPITYFEKELELNLKIQKGVFFSESPKNECLIGQALAKDMQISVGEEAIFLGQTQDGSISPVKAKVMGIIDSGNGVFDRQAYVSISQAQWMADIPEGATELLIFGNTSPEALKAQISPLETELKTISEAVDVDGKQAGLSITTWKEREPFATMYRFIKKVHSLLAFVIVFITALGVLNTMMMSVLERTSEIGVLRAMGMSRRDVASMFVLEAVLIALVGGIAGVLLGSGLSIWMEKFGIDLGTAAANVPDSMPINTTLTPDWSPELALLALGLGIVMAFIGAIIPALRAIKITPVDAMRAKRG